MSTPSIYTVATRRFEAACKIDTLAAEHRASRLHGHGYTVKVRLKNWGIKEQVNGEEVDVLEALLKKAVAPLDHQYLNDIVVNPTNENIARWVQAALGINADKIAVQSTPYEGVDIDRSGQAHVWQQYSFEAAHQLPNVAKGHQCGRMHGHGFKVILHATQPLGNAPMATDFEELSALWDSVAPSLENTCLNDIKGLENPTSEHLCSWLWQRLKPQLATLSFVSVYETATAGCHYDGEDFRIWKDFHFESALKLEKMQAGVARQVLHGHSYLARLHLQAPLDKVLGWTIDYGDVKSRFDPILDRLDHHTLNDLSGLASPSCANIAQWIGQEIDLGLPELDRVDCYERPGCGAVVSWSEAGPSLPI